MDQIKEGGNNQQTFILASEWASKAKSKREVYVFL